jgi:hypothetical protein
MPKFPLDEKTVLRRNPDFACRRIGEDTVLLPVYKTSSEMDCIYALNRDAAWVWERLDGRTPLGKIRERAAKAFSSSREEIGRELFALAGELVEIEAAGAARR